jgi:hypothetical protein
LEETVWPLTGDGSGTELEACYTATIIAGPPKLVGVTHTWD